MGNLERVRKAVPRGPSRQSAGESVNQGRRSSGERGEICCENERSRAFFAAYPCSEPDRRWPSWELCWDSAHARLFHEGEFLRFNRSPKHDRFHMDLRFQGNLAGFQTYCRPSQTESRKVFSQPIGVVA